MLAYTGREPVPASQYESGGVKALSRSRGLGVSSIAVAVCVLRRLRTVWERAGRFPGR